MTQTPVLRNSVGRQTLTISSSVVQLTVPATARHALLYLEATNEARMTADGTDPVAATTGILLQGDTAVDWFMDPSGDFHQILTDLEFIREGGTDAVLQVEYFD